jgi:hypothetical protein
MTWTYSDKNKLHIFIGTDPTSGEETYLAFVQEQDDGFRASVPDWRFQPRITRDIPQPWHYTHDTLQEAKEWCLVELVKRRLSL